MENPDFLIVGGGAAGCILASRLSEDPRRKVLLLEAGDDTPPGSVPADIDDIYPISYSNPRYFWPPMQATGVAGADLVDYLQPRVMGGGSSVMGMWALRGTAADYDAWERAGAHGWGWSDVRHAFNRLENDQDYSNADHGQDGPIPIRRIPGDRWPSFVNALASAAQRRGIAKREDFNADFSDGFFPVPIANDGLTRASSASGYLTSQVRARENLEILPRHTVSRILFNKNKAIAAEVLWEGGTRVIASREIILSAGGIHSPALLMRSGVGPEATLKAADIKTVLDLPGVGRRLMNHCVVNLATVLARNARLSDDIRTSGLACIRKSSGEEGTLAGDLHLQLIAQTSQYAHGRSIGVIGACLYGPISEGRITVTSRDPLETPKIDFNLLGHPADRMRMRRLIAFAKELLSDPEVAPLHSEIFSVVPTSFVRKLNRPSTLNRIASRALTLILNAPGPLRRLALRYAADAAFADDAASLDALLDRVVPVYHPAGACRMGRSDDPESVVDPSCRVIGVEGLRVVDASIMPVIPTANTCIPTMMVAEHAAGIITKNRESAKPRH